jgi:diguanylate cyclase (GGDEF)-like protein/PAS domain S-box-containing protein
VDKQSIRNWYLWTVTLVGAAVFAVCAYRLPVAKLDVKFVVVSLTTILVGSRITISVPRARGRISVSDTFVFLTMIMFGGEAAVLLATVEAFVSSIHFSRRFVVRGFNAGVMGLSTFTTWMAVQLFVGDISSLHAQFSVDLIVAVSVMALVQYVCNSGLIAVSVGLKLDEGLWRTWHSNFLWTSITYLAGAFGAGIVARLIDELGTLAFLATTPIIAVVYFTYQTYLSNIEASAAQAEQARLHVEELNRHLAEQARISAALEESEAHFRTAFDYAVIGMALVSPEGRWLRVNWSLCELLGYPEEEMLGTDFQSLTHPDDLGHDLAEINRMLAGEIFTFQSDKRFKHKLGHDVWTHASAALVCDAQGEPLHFIFQIHDITERKRAEAAIQTLSLVDELTGLYNRRGFMAFAEQHLASVHRSDKGLVILYADLDGLKAINDSLGHKEGDRALIKTAELFKETFRSSDVLGRIGGDEFTVLAAVDPDGGVNGLIARLERKFHDFNLLKLIPYELSISIGVAQLVEDEYQTIEDLLAIADEAMYENKRTKKLSSQSATETKPGAEEAVA